MHGFLSQITFVLQNCISCESESKCLKNWRGGGGGGGGGGIDLDFFRH